VRYNYFFEGASLEFNMEPLIQKIDVIGCKPVPVSSYTVPRSVLLQLHKAIARLVKI
jgi:hypothetical protein